MGTESQAGILPTDNPNSHMQASDNVTSQVERRIFLSQEGSTPRVISSRLLPHIVVVVVRYARLKQIVRPVSVQPPPLHVITSQSTLQKKKRNMAHPSATTHQPHVLGHGDVGSPVT